MRGNPVVPLQQNITVGRRETTGIPSYDGNLNYVVIYAHRSHRGGGSAVGMCYGASAPAHMPTGSPQGFAAPHSVERQP